MSMSDEEDGEQARDELPHQLEHWANRMISALTRDGEDAPSVLRRVMQLTSEVGRGDLAIDLLYAMTPDIADPDLWIDWIEGGRSPLARLKAPQFDDRKENSGRKITDARSAVERARETTADARSRLDQARAEAAAADEALRAAEDAEKRALDVARGLTAWAYLNEVSNLASTVFAMGPAWSMMRIVSGYLREDPEWEKTLSETNLKNLIRWKSTRAERSREMLLILHNLSGQARAEAVLFEEFYDILKKHERYASEGSARSMRTAKSGLGRQAKTDDAREVVANVKSTS